MSSVISSSTSPAASTASTATSAATASAASAGTAAVTSTGIGSGLNISAIVSSLTTSYGAAQQNQITNQANSLDSQVSAFGTFTSSLDSLQSSLGALETPSALAGFDASVLDKTVATATANSDAVAGSYSLAVQNIATAASLTSAAVAGATTAIGTGTLKIAVGDDSSTISIDPSDDSLAGIASAINKAPDNPGVTASILTTTAGSRLVLSGTATGSANGITVTETDGGNGLSSLVYDPANGVTNLSQTQAAQDANFTLNGYAATSASNVVSGAISGVTLNLVGASAAGTPTTLSITADTTTASKAITAFVTALSSTIGSIQTLTGYNASTQTAGALQGNATLQSFQNQLENILDTISSAGAGTNTAGGIQSLTDLGITANADGSYSTDATALTNALTANLSGVANLLGGTKGIATQIDALVKQYTQAGGILSTINAGLQTGLTDVSTEQTALNAELATYSATLTTQYNAMDAAVAALKETQTYLTAEFNPGSGSEQFLDQQSEQRHNQHLKGQEIMMYSQNQAAQYAAIRSRGQVTDASPARLVQIMFEHILSNLATAQGCMQRIKGNLPLGDVVAKGKAIGRAVRLIGQLDATLDMDKGGKIASNLRNLYLYMLERLTTANVRNDPQIVAEVAALVRKIKSGWDGLVKEVP